MSEALANSLPAVAGRTPETVFVPETLDELREVVRAPGALTLVPAGGRTRLELGNPTDGPFALLDLTRALRGPIQHQRDDLTLVVPAGLTIAEVNEALAPNGQVLPLDPPNPANATIGGTLAVGAGGPWRTRYGLPRDLVLGVTVLRADGELVKAGGRVVKNVTGYDLAKGLAGSWGTLAVVTDVTFKVLPAAETEKTLLLNGLDDHTAAEAMAAAMGSSAEVSGAAHLPEGVIAKFLGRALVGGAKTALRVEGFAPSVEYRIDLLARLLRSYGPAEVLETEQSRQLWREVRDCHPFADGTPAPVWRVSVAPTTGPRLLDTFRRAAGINAYYDWQGGLIWMRMEADPEAELLRKLIVHFGGGHATLIRAPVAVREAVDVFQPQPPQLAALSARLKEQFDPKNIMNPGRMVRPGQHPERTHD